MLLQELEHLELASA